MFERFTDRARTAMARANHAAVEFGHPDLTPQHLLVGILREGESVAIAVLDQLEVDRGALLAQAVTLLRGQTSVFSLSGKVTTGGVRGVIENAMAAAVELNVDHVGSEHLLLALARAQTTPASQLLMQFSVTAKRLTAVLRGLAPSTRDTVEAALPEDPPRSIRRGPAEVLRDTGVCPLCDRVRGEADGEIIADLRLARVLLGDNQGCAGWCVLVLKRHVIHLDELPIDEQAGLFAEVARVARAIRAVFPASGAGGGPPRINYECLGNQIGHIHWHVIPRHADDPDPRNAVWGWPAERLKGSMDAPARAELIARLRKALDAT